MTAALPQLCYGLPAGAVVEYLSSADRTCLKAVQNSVDLSSNVLGSLVRNMDYDVGSRGF